MLSDAEWAQVAADLMDRTGSRRAGMGGCVPVDRGLAQAGTGSRVGLFRQAEMPMVLDHCRRPAVTGPGGSFVGGEDGTA